MLKHEAKDFGPDKGGSVPGYRRPADGIRPVPILLDDCFRQNPQVGKQTIRYPVCTTANGSPARAKRW